jgi:CRISPR-associated endonuclease/helicase Cas3
MAPMGMGKTETALHAARLMGESAGASGLFVTLPTMATSDQMYGRVREYAERQIDGDSAVTLLHSMAWLNAAYAPQPAGGQLVTGEGDGELSDRSRTAATAWLRGRKRGLLAPLAVGTVDQALLTVLPVRHNVLRMLGLAGKVLVVDEVHAYDAYMQYLLARLLTWLGALGVPVVLLSATLPRPVAGRLVRAYLTGAGHRKAAAAFEPVYPGWAYADATTGTVTPGTFDVDSRTLTTELVPVPVYAESGVHRMGALRLLLAPLFADGGCAMVVCTTVAEAQETFRAVAAWRRDEGDDAVDLSGDPDRRSDEVGPTNGESRGHVGPLTLLHARMPAWRREQRTDRVVRSFGRDPQLRPRTASVLIATQVAEQSLDIDFDLVISDLAPVAQVLQRAGRCQRHPQVDEADLRPGWAAGGPRLAVLAPVGEDGALALPRRWTAVYDESLLRRTYDVLAMRTAGVVEIPGDVQPLVEEVYDETFVDGLPEEEIRRRMEDEARQGIAEMAAIPTPRALRDLEPLTRREVDEDQVSTRLGADSVRVVCCYVDGDGARWFDRERRRPLPAGGEHKSGRLTSRQVKDILAESIPVRADPWTRQDRHITATPPAWQDNPSLRDVLLLPHTLHADGTVTPPEVGGRHPHLDLWLGLVL